MNTDLDCSYFYNSRFHPAPPAAVGQWVDLARDPSAAHRLIRLGLSIRRDLPAMLLTEPGGEVRLLALRLAPHEGEQLAAGDGIGARRLRLFTSAWDPDCQRVRRLLGEVGVRYEEVEVDGDPKAEALVVERSGGRRVVPTLLFDDRLFAFNPDRRRLLRLLNEAGSEPGDG